MASSQVMALHQSAASCQAFSWPSCSRATSRWSVSSSKGALYATAILPWSSDARRSTTAANGGAHSTIAYALVGIRVWGLSYTISEVSEIDNLFQVLPTGSGHSQPTIDTSVSFAA